MRYSPARLNQLQDLRAKLNQMGDWYYQNDALTTYLDRTPAWNRRRISLRNKLNLIIIKAHTRPAII